MHFHFLKRTAKGMHAAVSLIVIGRSSATDLRKKYQVYQCELFSYLGRGDN